MNAEVVIWHLSVEADRLENAGPLTDSERLELRNVVERLWDVLTKELENVA